jgi:hypothetical protein
MLPARPGGTCRHHAGVGLSDVPRCGAAVRGEPHPQRRDERRVRDQAPPRPEARGRGAAVSRWGSRSGHRHPHRPGPQRGRD